MLRCRIDTRSCMRLPANPGSVVKRQIDQQSLSHVLHAHVQQISCKKNGKHSENNNQSNLLSVYNICHQARRLRVLVIRAALPIGARRPALQTLLFPDTSGTWVLCLRIMINVAPSAPSTMHHSFYNKCIPRPSITPTPAPTSSQIQHSPTLLALPTRNRLPPLQRRSLVHPRNRYPITRPPFRDLR
jgi:hypothetical protein